MIVEYDCNSAALEFAAVGISKNLCPPDAVSMHVRGRQDNALEYLIDTIAECHELRARQKSSPHVRV